MQDFLHILTTNNSLWVLLVAVISLCLGSFLNVIIIRLPKILQQQWQAACYQYLELEQPKNSESQKNEDLNLWHLCYPASHCTSCNHFLPL